MEECAVLVIGEGVVYFLVPYDASVRRRDIDQLDPKCISHEVIRQDGSALEAAVCPSITVRVSNVEPSDSDRLDFICRLGDGPLYGLLVVIGEDRWHDYGSARGG